MSNSNKIEGNKYSKIQYFFWLLSGAEISILKDCPTDFNRQAGIGFTIFMTTLLAFFSGSYAGYYFGESYTVAIIFGIIWATLIFSIDRSMVVTMKKDPTLEKQNFWLPFIARAVLSLLIAFIISIPLELLIFKDNIDLHTASFKERKLSQLKEAKELNNDIDEKFYLKGEIEGNISDLNNELNLGEPKNDPTYTILKNKVPPLRRKLFKSENKLIQLQNRYNNMSEFDDNYDRTHQNINSAKKQVSIDRKAYENAENEKNKYILNWSAQLNKEIKENRKRKSNLSNKIFETNEKQTNELDSLKIEQEKHDNSFIFRFMVLEDLANPTKKILKLEDNKDTTNINQNLTYNKKKIWVEEYDPEGATMSFMLWLIRILFFVIEILPTIAKMATPIGAYDRAIFQKEKDLEKDLYLRTEDYLKQQSKIREVENKYEIEQVENRNIIENQLHKELLVEISQAQNLVAKKKIEEFKNQHLS